MAQFEYEIEGLEELKEAIKRNPDFVKKEISKFLVRGSAEYIRTLLNNPWKVGMSGGGVPVATGNLRDTHTKTVFPYEVLIRPTAPYASSVHEKRPWLDYAYNENMGKLEKLEDDMMENIVNNLAK